MQRYTPLALEPKAVIVSTPLREWAVDGMREPGLSHTIIGEGIPVALHVKVASRPATATCLEGRASTCGGLLTILTK